MSWKKTVFENFKLYAVTAITNYDTGMFEKIEGVCRGGADILQLRSKTLTDLEMYRLGLKIKEIAHRNETLFIVNDRPDIAVALGADGVHLGQEDLPVQVVRDWIKSSPEPFWIGKSTHSFPQAREAVDEGADYIGVGPVFETPTKPHVTAVGLELVRQVAENGSIPFVAIGGIHSQNLEAVLQAGAKRIAVVRALFDSENPESEARRLRGKIEEYEKQYV